MILDANAHTIQMDVVTRVQILYIVGIVRRKPPFRLLRQDSNRWNVSDHIAVIHEKNTSVRLMMNVASPCCLDKSPYLFFLFYFVM